MFFKSVSHVMMKVTNWVVHLAPIGVAFLIAGEILHMKSVMAELTKLAWYLVTVTLGITFHGFVILPLIYSIATRSLPFKFIGKVTLTIKFLIFKILNIYLATDGTCLGHSLRHGQQLGHPASDGVQPGGGLQGGVQDCQVHPPHRRHHQHGRHRPL